MSYNYDKKNEKSNIEIPISGFFFIYLILANKIKQKKL